MATIFIGIGSGFLLFRAIARNIMMQKQSGRLALNPYGGITALFAEFIALAVGFVVFFVNLYGIDESTTSLILNIAGASFLLLLALISLAKKGKNTFFELGCVPGITIASSLILIGTALF